MELRNAWWNEDQDALSLDGLPVGQAGDADADLVELAVLELDATIGAENFEVDSAGQMLCTVGGSNFAVVLCQVKTADGRPDDKLAFIGVRTQAQLADAVEEDE
jgi:hypothetical protein